VLCFCWMTHSLLFSRLVRWLACWTFTTAKITRRELPRFVEPIHMHVFLCMRGARGVSVHSPACCGSCKIGLFFFFFFFEAGLSSARTLITHTHRLTPVKWRVGGLLSSPRPLEILLMNVFVFALLCAMAMLVKIGLWRASWPWGRLVVTR
jgi:hypothetical protein